MSVRAATALAAARTAGAAYAAWAGDFGWSTRRAGARFAARDWAGAEADAARRLALWYRWVDHAAAAIRRQMGAARADRGLWHAARDAYAADAAAGPDGEIAESFYNSLARRVLATPGLDPEVHFVRAVPRPTPAADAAERRAVMRPLDPAAGPEALARALLGVWQGPVVYGAPRDLAYRNPAHRAPDDPAAWPQLAAPGRAGDPRWADHARDVRRVADALDGACRQTLGGWPDAADVIAAPFFRGHAAYVVARLARGDRRTGVALALRHPTPAGVEADAVLAGEDDLSILFGFAWSYFHVDAPVPRALVDALASVLPRKRRDELYTAIGYHRHAKTELFRLLQAHLASGSEHFARAPGARGLVMECVTLDGLDVVLKLIKDRFGEPKRTTRRQVMERYHFVFVRDRVGRLADAQEFEGLVFRRRCFPEALLGELAAAAPSVVRPGYGPGGDRVLVTHCYTERRLTPLDLYVRAAPPDAAVAAVVDYGQAVRDLAVAGIFAGDLLLKNFGVSRHGRVIFYDYDELAALSECRFRSLAELGAGDDDGWYGAEPSAGVAEGDVFPEEFARFTLPAGPLREAFLAHHADLLAPGWWEATQARLAAGEVVEAFPYPASRRLAPA